MDNSLESAYRQSQQQIAQLERELAEFRASSLELEHELELELEEKEKVELELLNSVKSLNDEVAQWKNKYLELQKEYSASQASLQKQISSLQEAHRSVSTRLREIEMVNDHMEQHERITKTSLEQAEEKYHESLEKIALLEAELAGKESLAIDLQRARDELRDAKEELAVVRRRTEKENMAPQPNEVSARGEARKPSMGLTHSKSLRKIHTMATKMADIQSRVTNFKSALPAPPSTPKPYAGSRSPADSSGSPSPTNIPVASARLRHANGDDAVTPFRAATNRWLDTIEGSPTDSSPRRSSSSQGRRVVSSTRGNGTLRSSQHTPLPSAASVQSSLRPQRPTDPSSQPTSRPSSRPGSAFSALHSRPAFGHGRF